MFGKNKVAIIVAEFMGTFVLASAVLAAITAGAGLVETATAAGVVLGLLVLTIGAISGAHVNPAVTLGLWSVKKIETQKAVVYWVSQFLGGLAAWKLHDYLRGSTLTSIATSGHSGKVLIAEAIGALVFTFGIAAAVSKSYESGKLAAAVGGSLFAGILIAAGLGSNGVLNPAVAVGIQSWSWTYLLGPVLGALVGMNLYRVLFAEVPSKKKH